MLTIRKWFEISQDLLLISALRRESKYVRPVLLNQSLLVIVPTVVKHIEAVHTALLFLVPFNILFRLDLQLTHQFLNLTHSVFFLNHYHDHTFVFLIPIEYLFLQHIQVKEPWG